MKLFLANKEQKIFFYLKINIFYIIELIIMSILHNFFHLRIIDK